MTSRQLILLLVGLIGLGIIFTAGKMLITKPEETPTPTPSVTATPSVVVPVEVGFSGNVTERGITITPVSIVEDSRCPANVNCIQAGTVRIKATVQLQDEQATSTILVLNTPSTFDERTITLVDVKPVTIAGKQIASKDYRFMFRIE